MTTYWKCLFYTQKFLKQTYNIGVNASNYTLDEKVGFINKIKYNQNLKLKFF